LQIKDPPSAASCVVSLALCILTVWFAIGCGGDAQPEAASDAGPGRERSWSPGVQQLLAQLIDQTEHELSGTAHNSGAKEVTPTYSLLGSDMGEGVFASLAMSCEVANLSGVTCSSELSPMPVWPGLDTCFQTGCDGPGELFVDVYITALRHREANDRVPIMYATGKPYPAGTVTYDPNPLTRWQITSTQAGAVTVSARLDETVRVHLDAEGTFDFSYTAELDGSNSPGNPYHLHMELPRVSSLGALNVTIDNSDAAPKVGRVERGDTTIALLSDDGIHWQ
jgi:hypothetical protein